MIDRPRLISAKVHCLRDLCIPAIDVGKETDAAIFIQISGVINQSYRDFAGKSDETFLSAVGECFFKFQNTAILFSPYPSKTGVILHAHATVAPVPLRAFEKVLGRRVVQVDRIIVAPVELDLSQRIIRSGKLYYPAIQIGRASGRERGCQYVKILLVAET